ncbi:FAD-dependent oxidoreductase [Deinococcus planocerae]|uniref:FAD-dependent oxidoreductase n=1 Tax=Deinococcus planocerae TaxID=1737569 RepID=UPI000C7EE00F|nr:NAD(P)/FAD-dependent oxidoreductase [Deinococcus planocerae]
MLDVLVVGGGPVGLFLGCLLARRELSVAVLERRLARSGHSRAVGIHPPALAAFEEVGLTTPLLAAGVPITGGVVLGRGGVIGELSFRAASPRYPLILSLPQRDTERVLEERLARLAPGALRRGVEVVGLRDEGGHVSVACRESGRGETLRARLVVGADGTRSTVRGLAGIGFPGGTYPDSYLMGDFPDTTAFGPRAAISLMEDGVVESFPLPGEQRRWVVYTETLRDDARAQDLAALVRGRTGLHLPARDCTMLSAFGVRHHLADRMVAGRVLLVGDAAHEVSPIGGQGMNLGWLDAAALAPLLGKALGGAPGAGAALLRYERARLRSARLATRQAEFNMVFGRPARGPARRVRDAVLRGLLSSPVQPLLARAFTMRWL